VDITVHFRGATVKQLERAWQEAVRRGQVASDSAYHRLAGGRARPHRHTGGRPGRGKRAHGLPLAARLHPAAGGQLALRHGAGAPEQVDPHAEGAPQRSGRGGAAGGRLSDRLLE